MKVKGPYADKEECRKCVANIGGRCKTLVDTTWIIKNCPFATTEEQLQRDRKLLEKAISEGRVKRNDQ